MSEITKTYTNVKPINKNIYNLFWEYEEKHGIKIPIPYKNLFYKYNGGSPTKDLAFGNHEIKNLLSFDKEDADNVWLANKDLKIEGFGAFAVEKSSNYVGFKSFKGEKDIKIATYNKENDKLIIISGQDEFIKKIYPIKWDRDTLDSYKADKKSEVVIYDFKGNSHEKPYSLCKIYGENEQSVFSYSYFMKVAGENVHYKLSLEKILYFLNFPYEAQREAFNIWSNKKG